MQATYKLPLSGKKGKGKFALVPAPLRAELLKNQWQCNSKGCAVGKVRGMKTPLQRRVWDLLVKRGLKPATDKERYQIAHIDGDKLNNTVNNLHAVTNQQNKGERRPSATPRSRQNSEYMGVTSNKQRDGWLARYKGIFLGKSKDPLVCAHMHDHAAALNKDGRTNFPELSPTDKLSAAATARVVRYVEFASECKEEGVHPQLNGKFRVCVDHTSVCKVSTLEEAVKWRDMARQKGARHTREVFANTFTAML